MATVSPEPQTMDRTLAPQPKLADNGCCCHCCGKAPGPIDAANITRDGGKYIQHADGRVVEYFVYGAADGDRVMLQINGSMGTGWLPANTELNVAKLKELNVKGVSITIPGYGYTSLFPKGYRLGDWPKMDVEPVLAAEGLAGKPLAVEGTSYGAGIALAVAAHFGERVSHLHLHVPYINSELRKELGFPLKIGDDGVQGSIHAWQQWLQTFLNTAPPHLVTVVIEVTPGAADQGESHTGFDQASRQQCFFSDAVATVKIAHLVALFVEIEGTLCPP